MDPITLCENFNWLCYPVALVVKPDVPDVKSSERRNWHILSLKRHADG